MNTSKIYIMAVIFLFSSISKIKSADYFTDRGSYWFGGNFTYAYMNIWGDKVNQFIFTPIIRSFPLKHLIVGPKFQWTLMVFKDESTYGDSKNRINNVNFGLDLGFAYGKDIPVIPYFIICPLFDLLVDHHIDEDYDNTYRESGFTLHASIGIFIKFADYLGLQIAPNYQFSTMLEPSHSFSVTIGFGYIGKRHAFSFGQSFMQIIDL